MKSDMENNTATFLLQVNKSHRNQTTQLDLFHFIGLDSL